MTLAEFLNLLLLERGLTLSDVLITISQPQPGLRHVGEGDPRFPLSKRARHFNAFFRAQPILVCSTQYSPRPSVRR